MTCDHCGGTEDDVRKCGTCDSVFCAKCRKAISGREEHCPICGDYVGDSQLCRLAGGCGR